MTVTVEEKADGRGAEAGSSSSREYQYIVRGATNTEQALGYALARVPRKREGFVLDSVSMDEIATDIFEATVGYVPDTKSPAQQETLPPPSLSFSTSGATQKVTQAYRTQAYSAGGTPPDFKGAIGVSGEGKDQKVEGVDIVVPKLSFSETHHFRPAMIGWSYIKTLAGLTGRINAAPFRGFAAGELLFTGAEGSLSGEDDFPITYRFEASSNAYGLQIGEISVAVKRGWDYLWVRYVKSEDAAAKAVIPIPKFAYVCEVYQAGHFGALGIG